MDAYNTELKAMVDVIDGKADRSVIRSSYEDAFETYKLARKTWAIRLEGEKACKARQDEPVVSN
ncbi:hypothetical protein JCM24511_03479 [Saitozyma sp. JCM 24511]|nr:hypothetical protein JCM24511_03479 [Saitozyma sp. JCM 24511]